MEKAAAPSSAAALEDLKGRVAMACRVLHHRGLMRSIGHVTARVPGTDRFLLGMNRFTHGRTRPEDLLTFDLEGRKVDGPDIPLPRETFIYTETLKARADVESVVHVHMPTSLAFGVARLDILPLYVQCAEVVRFGVPVVDSPMIVSTVDRGRAIARALKDAHACHMRGHGQVIVGRSVEHAAALTIQLEEQAEINLKARQLTDTPFACTQGEVEEFIYEDKRTPETVLSSPFSSIWSRGKPGPLGPLSLYALEMDPEDR